MDRSCRGPPMANHLSVPSSDEVVYSDDEILREIEEYTIEAEREDCVQAGNPPICARIGRPVVGGSKFV